MTDRVNTRTVINWDSHNWKKALDYWAAYLPSGRPLKVLELGCGPGGLSLWLAAQGYDVVCSDIELPGVAVRSLHASHGFTNRIKYAQIDATNIPYVSEFDVIVTKSVLGGVGFGHRTDRIGLAVDQVHRALKPGGMYLFAENLTGTSLHQFLRCRFRRWGGAWHYFGYSELLGYFGAFASIEHRTVGFLGLFGWRECVRRGLGVIDTLLFDWIIPAPKRYIMAGVARK